MVPHSNRWLGEALMAQPSKAHNEGPYLGAHARVEGLHFVAELIVVV